MSVKYGRKFTLNSGGSRISQKGVQPQRGHWPIIWHNFGPKLHENKKNGLRAGSDCYKEHISAITNMATSDFERLETVSAWLLYFLSGGRHQLIILALLLCVRTHS